jgi:hypothetical protein
MPSQQDCRAAEAFDTPEDGMRGINRHSNTDNHPPIYRIIRIVPAGRSHENNDN